MSQQINLYNPIFLKQEKHFSARTIVQALGLIVAALGAFYVYALVQTRAAETVTREQRDRVAAQREQLVKLGPQFSPEGRSKALEAEVARLEAEVKARESVLGALSTGELGNTAGFSEFLAALGRRAVPGVWLTGLNVGEAGNDLQLSGRALRPELVPVYLKALSEEPMMRGRRVTEMKLAAKVAAPAPALAGGPTSAAPGPRRYIEFSVSAPLLTPDAPKGVKP
jgi:hypothetical protein